MKQFRSIFHSYATPGEATAIKKEREIMNLNRELHEAFGHCCHEPVSGSELRLHPSNPMSYICSKCGERYAEDFCPNYVADPRLVIREMRKRDGFGDFLDVIDGEGDNLSCPIRIPLDLIMDTTGKLAQLALDWLKGEVT